MKEQHKHWCGDSDKCWRNGKAIDCPSVTHDDDCSAIARFDLKHKVIPHWCSYQLEHIMKMQQC